MLGNIAEVWFLGYNHLGRSVKATEAGRQVPGRRCKSKGTEVKSRHEYVSILFLLEHRVWDIA